MGVAAAFRSIEQSKLDELRAMKPVDALIVLNDLAAKEPDNSIDVDKAWDGLHYLFTGRSLQPSMGSLIAKGIGKLLGGGKSKEAPSESSGIPAVLGEIMSGGPTLCGTLDDGVTNYLDSAKTRAIHEALNSVADEVLLARFDGEAMAKSGVYLSSFWKRDREQALSYLKEHLSILRKIFKDAADENKAVLRTWC